MLCSTHRRAAFHAGAWLPWFLLVIGLLNSASLLHADEFQYPLSVAADSSGAIYVADLELPGVWKIADPESTIYFQGAKTFRTPLNRPRCLALDAAGHLLAGDTSTREVYRFGDDQQPVALTKGSIGKPMGIAVNKANQILVSDQEQQCIWSISAEGGEPEKLADVPAPRGIRIDDQDRLWIISHGKDQLLRMQSDGKLEVVVAGRPFQFPHDVAFDGQQKAYVSDGYAKTIWLVADGADPKAFAQGEPFMNPVGLAWSGEKLLVADPKAKAIFSVDAEGAITKLR